MIADNLNNIAQCKKRRSGKYKVHYIDNIPKHRFSSLAQETSHFPNLKYRTVSLLKSLFLKSVPMKRKCKGGLEAEGGGKVDNSGKQRIERRSQHKDQASFGTHSPLSTLSPI